jgi:hypothetical protein
MPLNWATDYVQKQPVPIVPNAMKISDAQFPRSSTPDFPHRAEFVKGQRPLLGSNGGVKRNESALPRSLSPLILGAKIRCWTYLGPAVVLSS